MKCLHVLSVRSAFIGLMGLLVSLSVAAQPKPLQNLSVIVFPAGSNLPLWAAERQGYFEQNGLRVTLVNTPSSTFQMQGFAEGRFDIAMTAMDNVVAYREGLGEAKLPPQPGIFAFLGADSGFLSVVGGQGIRGFADLKGRKLAVDAMSTGFAFVLRELLARGGVAESEVSFDRVGGSPARFGALLKGTHAGAVLTTPYDALAARDGLAVLAKAERQLGAYQGLVGAARRSWHQQNEAALVGFIRAYQAGVAFIYEGKNRNVAEALLVANLRAMNPQLARQSLDVLLDEKSGLTRDGALDMKGVQTVLGLRARFTGQALAETASYVDTTYWSRAAAAK